MKQKTIFFCSECGNEQGKWTGQCSACSAWNTLTEAPKKEASSRQSVVSPAGRKNQIVSLDEVGTAEEIRFSTGLGELDRVLGGGAVVGSLVLLSGEPGIGKSTLLMQICQSLSRFEILYISGEESPRQLKLRADRLHVKKLKILAETNFDNIFEAIDSAKPDIIIIDSIQTMYKPDLQSAPGNTAQVKECSLLLMELAKSRGITVLVIGHVNKDGAIAGPKVLEHMVDCVLYFEGSKDLTTRVLRAGKNRFGATSEIGVFEMRSTGLYEVLNPSEMLLSGRGHGVPGTCVACAMEGSRPMLAEVQALAAPTSFGVPRRVINGMDYNRVMLLIAVLEKRAGLFLGNHDVYVNVVGGFRMDEPACDLPTLLALTSSLKDIPLPADLAAFGEIGLTGEMRAVPAISQRLSECSRLGFKRCAVPRAGTKDELPEGTELIRAKNIREAIGACFR